MDRRIAARPATRGCSSAGPNLIPVHTPRHASWLNQIEIYFSIVQRKVLTPNDFATLAALEHYLLAFQARYQAIATPFRWTFTRADLHQLLARLAAAARRCGRPPERAEYVTVIAKHWT